MVKLETVGTLAVLGIAGYLLFKAYKNIPIVKGEISKLGLTSAKDALITRKKSTPITIISEGGQTQYYEQGAQATYKYDEEELEHLTPYQKSLFAQGQTLEEVTGKQKTIDTAFSFLLKQIPIINLFQK